MKLFVPTELRKQIETYPICEVQDLHCGDIFLFRDDLYLCLSNFTDRRHTQTVLTTIHQCDSCSLNKITVLRLFRTFQVHRITVRVPLEIEVLHNTDEEVVKTTKNPALELSDPFRST